MTSVLFVCLGNICRSPMAEGILRARLRERGLEGFYEVDSAGTAAYHEGEPADVRTQSVLRARGELCPLVARQVRPADLERFDWILAMDASNFTELRRRCTKDPGERLALALAPTGGGDVPDPYYGGPGGFDAVYAMLDEALEHWLDRWEAERLGEG